MRPIPHVSIIVNLLRNEYLQLVRNGNGNLPVGPQPSCGHTSSAGANKTYGQHCLLIFSFNHVRIVSPSANIKRYYF